MKNRMLTLLRWFVSSAFFSRANFARFHTFIALQNSVREDLFTSLDVKVTQQLPRILHNAQCNGFATVICRSLSLLCIVRDCDYEHHIIFFLDAKLAFGIFSIWLVIRLILLVVANFHLLFIILFYFVFGGLATSFQPESNGI